MTASVTLAWAGGLALLYVLIFVGLWALLYSYGEQELADDRATGGAHD